MTKYGNLGPDTRKMKIFEKLIFHVKCLTLTFPMSPQTLSDDNFSSRYVWSLFPYLTFWADCCERTLWMAPNSVL